MCWKEKGGILDSGQTENSGFTFENSEDASLPSMQIHGHYKNRFRRITVRPAPNHLKSPQEDEKFPQLLDSPKY